MFEAAFEFVKANYWAYYLFFLFGAVARSLTIFGIGRLGHRLLMESKEPEGGLRARAWRKAHARRTQETVALIKERGIWIIPLGFLTIGLQSLINVSAGVMGMQWRRYVMAALPGWLVWAALYSTVGLALIAKPVTALVLLAILAVAYFGIYRPHTRGDADSTREIPLEAREKEYARAK